MKQRHSVFYRDYTGLHLWSNYATEAEDQIEGKDISDLSPEAIAKIDVDTNEWHNWFDATVSTDIYSQAGHDLWLTRNRHGTGYWDRPEYYGKALAAALTDYAHKIGELNLVVGDDGKLHLE